MAVEGLRRELPAHVLVLSWSITADELDEPSEEQQETETAVAACFKASSSATQ